MKKTLFSFWLIFLAVFAGPPATGFAFEAAYQAAYVAAGKAVESTASAPNLYFDCLSVSEGLSFGLVTSMIQDHRGFMWFGTRYGLNKYDGFNFTVYTFDSGEDPLYDNYIRGLYEDRSGDLWISTYSDLVRRDGESGQFIHYKHEATNSRSLGPGLITSIGEDNQGFLWVGTERGFNRYEPSTDSFTRVSQGQAVASAYFDRQGGFWLGTNDGLLYDALGQPGQRGSEIYRHDPSDPASLSHNIVNVIVQDRQGMLWLGTGSDGLNRLDRSTGTITRFQHNPDDPDSISHNSILSILEDSLDRLWIGTFDGLNVFDRSTGRFFHYQSKPGDPHSLNNDVVIDLYQDRSGVVWIATEVGICKVNETAGRFTHYQQAPGQPDQQAVVWPGSHPVLSDENITAIYQDRQGFLWIGTNSGGLNRLGRSTGSVTVYQYDPADPTSLNFGEVNAIYEDCSGTLWVGTSTGLARFNAQTGTFIAEEAFREQTILVITEDQQGNLWVGSWGGVSFKEPGASDFIAVQTRGNLLPAELIQAIYPDRNGSVWISAQSSGLYRLDPAEASDESNPTLIHFPQDSDDPTSPGESPVLSFFEDSQGVLWMGSIGNGLLRFNQDTQTFSHYLPRTGVAQYISCIQGDAQGFLWMGTLLGLARFDPHSETFAYFDSRDGLEIGIGMTRCFQNEQGEMFFAGLKGLHTFFPDQIQANPRPPAVVITALNLNNQPFRTDLLPDEQIEMTYQENYLSFDFAALDYIAPAKNQYAYKMEGVDPDWIDAGTRHHADYPDLKPGTYTFRVKASNNSGVWNEQGVAVHISLTPPFWQTWWFLGTVGLVLAGVILGGLRLRVKGLEARSRDLEKQVHERTGALEQKTQELEVLLAENARLSQQSQDLAVLEERNRLARDLHDSVSQSLYGVTLYAEIAAQLLKSRDFEKAGTHLQELKAMALDSLGEMRLMIYELRPSVLEQEGLVAAIQSRLDAVESRVGLKTKFSIQGAITLPPRLEAGLYRITQEALNNVLKHAHASNVSITLAQDEHTITMEVADDGVGFDPLQARDSGCLGLRNMQERAQELGMTIEILSQPGKGTQIILKRSLS